MGLDILNIVVSNPTKVEDYLNTISLETNEETGEIEIKNQK
jgi:hypothetical protein